MSLSANSPSSAAVEALESLRANRGWFIALGLAFIVLGLIALGNLFTATVVTALYAGILIVVAGAAQIFHAFSVKGWGAFFFWLLAGLFYAVAGVLIITQPLLAAGVITLVLGVVLAVEGIFRIIAALKSKHAKGWGWIVASGAVTLALGLLIIARWPINSLYILGLFLGVDLMFNGIGTLLFGLALKKTQP